MANEPTRTLPPTASAPNASEAALTPTSQEESAESTAHRVADKDTDVPRPCAEMAPTLGIEEPPAEAAAPVNRHFGDYELLAEIARGGMGVVYKAQQKSLQRVIALKMILANHLASAEQVRRFHVEAEEAGRLDHPNIVPIYQVGEEQGQHYFTMKLFEAGSLDEHRTRFQQNPQAAVRLVAVTARAVHYAHQRGILHRDLKPGNILLDAEDQPHVTDFGLAKHLGEAAPHTQSGVVVGTPSYMAPEQAAARKDLSIAVDVYSLGAILFELLTGRPPFKGTSTMDTILQVMEKEPPRPRSLNPRLDRDLETITLKCLEKNPQRRYANALYLAEDLERYQSGKPIRARPASRRERTVKWVRRRPATAALVGVIALAVLSMLGMGIGDNIRLQAAYKEAQWQRQAAEDQRQVAEERQQLAEMHQQLAQTQRLEAEHQKQRAESSAEEARRQAVLVQASLKKRLEIIDDFLYRMDGRLEKSNVRASVRQEFLHDAIQLSEDVLKEHPKDANARRQTARLYYSSGELWRTMRSFPDANAAFAKAIALQRQLASEFPEEGDYRSELALTHAQHGRLLRDFRRYKDARLAYDEAIRLDDELARRNPKDAAYRQRGALDRFRRADLFEEMGQKTPAEAGYRDALGRQEQLISNQPGEPEFLAKLAVTAASLSALLAQKDPAKGLPYLEKSVQSFRQAMRLAPHIDQYGRDLRNAYIDLSDLLAKCGRHAELAKMAEAYRQDFPDDGGETYNAACFMAWASRTARDSKQLPEAERKRLSDRYGKRAVKLLDMSIHEGYRDRSHMDWDTDLDPLRNRKDYQELIAALDRRFPTPQTPKQEFEVFRREYQAAYNSYYYRLQQARTVADKNKARAKQPNFAEFAERLFQMAEKHRDNSTAIEALSWLLERTASQAKAWTAIRRRALEMLRRDHAQKPELAQLCQTLSATPAADCEELLRTVLAKHSQADVRGLAGYALAQSLLQQAETAQRTGASQAAELFLAAEKQLGEVIKTYGSVPSGKSSLGEVAKAKLYALRHLSIGRPAREIEGRDLDGKPMKLSDYRGKVVVLDFWADWCGYCRQMYPQERALVAQMKDRPFALLGINCDDDLAKAQRAVEKDKLRWRSWQDGGRGGDRITTQWQVSAFPTIYVLDAKGVIRYKDVRGSALDKAVAQLLQEMGK